MSQVTVTLPDGSTKQIPSGAPVKAVAEAISPRLADAAYVAFVDDKLVDLTYPLTQDAKVRIVTNKNPEALEVYRHSTAHLLAAAVTALFPKVQCGIGPPIEDGFYYDFIVERPFVPEDLEAIEKKMKRARAGRFHLRAPAVAAAGGDRLLHEARRAAEGAADRGEDGRPGARSRSTRSRTRRRSSTSASVRTCRRTGRLKAFKLTATSNAYWKGDAKNAPMQRVYGTAFFSQKELDEHLDAHRGSEEARSPQARKRARPLPLPPRRARRRVLDAARHDALQHARRLLRRSGRRRTSRRSRHRSSTTRRCGSSRATGASTGRTCSWC